MATRLPRISPLLLALLLTACGGASNSAPLPVTVESLAPVQGAGEGHIYYPGLAIDDAPEALIGDHITDPQYLAVLCFDLGGITEFTSATLHFHRASIVGDPWSLGPLIIDHFAGTGLLEQSQKAGDDIVEGFFEFNANEPSYSVDVTQRVADDVFMGRGFSSFRLHFAIPNSVNGAADQLLIGTSKNADPSLRPVLVITTPTP